MRLTTRSTNSRRTRRRPKEASVRNPPPTALDLDLRDVEATLEPLERATMLPPRAFVDPGVFEWELERIFGGWVCVGHASLLTEPGSYLMREIGDDSIVVM